MKIISIQLADEMDQYYDDITEFLHLMIHKLQKNVHKGRWENMTDVEACRHLMGEVEELLEAIGCNDSNEIFLESADIANFAMILASITRAKCQTSSTS